MKWPCRGAMQDSAFSFNPVDRFRYVRVISRLNPRGARPSRRRSRITFGERGRVRASRRKAKKRNAACEVSVRGRRNKSVRPCRRSPLRGHSFPSCHPIFFFSPDVSCGIDPKTNGTRRVGVARGHEENREKVRERMREREGKGETIGRARERKRDNIRVM